MKYPEDQTTPAHLAQFREKVTEARRKAGRQQQDLAKILGLDSHVLSRKLHGRGRAQLVHQEVKKIVQTLATWDAISTRTEAIELLTLMGLREESFTCQEWEMEPLKHLEATSPPALSSTMKRQRCWPVPLTSYLPRQDLEERIIERLRQPEMRLLTLLGTGGVGKTRLSLAVIPALERDFPDGIFFVPLDGLQDAAMVPYAIMEMLNLVESSKEDGPSVEERLKLFLSSRRILLILDNFEHLLSARELVAMLLIAAPYVKILVTSRHVLDVYGEQLLHITPLELVDPDALEDHATLMQNTAIRLFVERVRTITDGSLIVNEQNASIIARICHNLDGLPLAIELAAARCRLITPVQLLDQLRRRSYLPRKGDDDKSAPHTLWRQEFHGLVARQRTLQFTLDWSYQLLSRSLQPIFTRLSVFAGSWSLEAAQYVCECQREAMWSALEELVNQSLLLLLPSEQTVPAEGPRFVFLRMIHEYAQARSTEHSGYEAARKRHALYYLNFAEHLEPLLWSKERPQALQQLAYEQENLRTALHWSIEQKDAALAQRFCGLLSIYWEARGHFTEGWRWLDAALALDQTSVSASVHATCLLMASRLAIWQMSYQCSREYAQRALEYFERAHDEVGQERALFQLGDSWHLEGEQRAAISYFEKCLILQRRLGQQRDYAFTQGRLGTIALLNGEVTGVEEQFIEVVDTFRRYGERSGIGMALNCLGFLYLFQGRLHKSLSVLRESLKIAQEEGYQYNLAMTLMMLGCALGNISGPEATARLCSAAEVHFQQIGSSLPRGYQAAYRWYLTGIQARTSVDNWNRWWQEGSSLLIHQAVVLAYQQSEQSSLQSV